MLASVLCNLHRGKGERARRPEEFMPRFRRREPESAESMWGKLTAWAAAANGAGARRR